MRKNLLLTTLAVLTVCSRLSAQQLLGIANSNFAGTNGLFINPSFVSDSRHGFTLNLITADVHASNTYMRYNGSTSIYKMLKNDSEIEESYLEEKFNGKSKLFTSSVDFRGPAFMLTMSPKHSFGITTRVKGALQGNNISENVAKLIKTADSEDILNKFNDGNQFSLNGNVNAELGLTYGRVLYNTDKHVLKGGITLKRVTGIYSSYFVNEGSRYKVTERTDANAEYYKVLEIENVNARYGYLTTDLIQDIEASDVMRWLTMGKAPGKGWGMDLGFTYEFRPEVEQYKYKVDSTLYLDNQKNKYKYRLGISLMDVGGVKYKSKYARSLDISRQNVELAPRDLEEAENTPEYAAVLNRAFGIQPTDIKNSFRSGLPTALNINLDTKVRGRFYVNTTLIQSLRGKGAAAMRQNSLVAVIPRFEFKWLELALPLSVQNNYRVFSAGAMVKMGPFFIGSDNIGGAFNIGKPYGANVYSGVSLLAINRARKKEPKPKKIKTQTITPAVVPVPASVPAVPDSTAPAKPPVPAPNPIKE